MNQDLAPNIILSHYRILLKLGAGGMGEVYLAEDTKLDRKVALKILPTQFADDADRMNRFVREAKSASALNHPNIITIHEIGEVAGTHFIASEYVQGQTLHNRLRQSPLDLKATLDLAIQVASALNAAHKAGIIHRDIKPENVMIRPDGLVKILDFGIAKLSAKKVEATDEEAATALKPQGTSPGVIIGTANYMSPEQARGKDVGPQSDIFSFGIVLYEMVTGQRAFNGENALDVIGAILHKEPTPLNQLSPDLPHEIERIINKTLRKDPDARYQTAGDLLTDLKDARQELEFQDKLERTVAPAGDNTKTKTITVPSTAAASQSTSSAEFITQEVKKHKLGVILGALLVLALLGGGFWFFYHRSVVGNNGSIASIAVLPFQNKSPDADTDYLSDGLAESLIYRLSQLPNLKVSPTSSVTRYKGKDTEVAKIASELGVDAVMTGRLAQIGDNLTISVELVDVRNNKLLWGEQYERKMSDLLATQREIAATITEKLQLKLSGDDAKGIAKKYTDNNEAYQIYLKGRFYGSKRTAKDAQKAIESYQQAITIDPKFALAYAGLAEANWFLALYSYPQQNELVPKSRELALKAIELDGSLAEPHSVLAIICTSYDHDFGCGEREQKRAIELNPNYWEGHRRLGLLLMNLGRFGEAEVATRRALEIDPLAPVTNQNYANLLFYEKKYAESEALSKKNIDLDPNYWYAHWQLFMVYLEKHDYPAAVEELAKTQDSRGEPDAAKFIRESFADGDWTGFLKKITGDRTRLKLYPYFVSIFFAELGEKDKAFAMLNEAIETKDQHIGQMKVDQFMDPLRGDPRFREVMKKAGFPE